MVGNIAGSRQTWCWRKLRVLYLDLKAAEDTVTGHDLSIYETSRPLPHNDVSFYKATAPNGATPYGPMGASYIQTTTLLVWSVLLAAGRLHEGNRALRVFLRGFQGKERQLTCGYCPEPCSF